MTFDMHIRILIDAREFVHGRFTGIARVLQGLTESLVESTFCREVLLAVHDSGFIPSRLKRQRKVAAKEIPKPFLKSEKALSDLTRHFDLYISPYPKLPLFGVHCLAVNTIHDVLDLTHPLYRRRFKTVFDKYRLRRALRRADLTWYDSLWSMQETQKHFEGCGRNPRVRHPGIDGSFVPEKQQEDDRILETYGLKEGYVLALGNGMPHKNLGILLEIAPLLERQVVFVGVPDKNRQYWGTGPLAPSSVWIDHVDERNLPTLLRGAFCLVQPSIEEGYGYPPLEAMACGTPTVVSDIPVLQETTGGNALAVNPYDSGAWAQALRALEDETTYRRIKEKGLKWVRAFQGLNAWIYQMHDLELLLERK
jgi:glycosyltransferase involved in cell wall biosynthesis